MCIEKEVAKVEDCTFWLAIYQTLLEMLLETPPNFEYKATTDIYIDWITTTTHCLAGLNFRRQIGSLRNKNPLHTLKEFIIGPVPING